MKQVRGVFMPAAPAVAPLVAEAAAAEPNTLDPAAEAAAARLYLLKPDEDDVNVIVFATLDCSASNLDLDLQRKRALALHSLPTRSFDAGKSVSSCFSVDSSFDAEVHSQLCGRVREAKS
jgi:hypothetical protein